ncbi:hypothetical protein FEZ48_13975 [Marinilactibacillus psychrotolerans]|uniref:Uncharacterized protein n=1 Tax=Marinilactibacillus psychrotolerans TaxID=191770 RepID=A0A5R9BSU9_9LACT|nr:hypothetical protein [Marinilactibacillus psychrotolerans]TLQ03695.1 hypothetical protein FEZ48_13975 [Marinilactibacillus psychrotolerans]
MNKYRVVRKFKNTKSKMKISLIFNTYEEAKEFVEEVCFSDKEDYKFLKDSNDFHQEFHGSREIVSIDIVEGAGG